MGVSFQKLWAYKDLRQESALENISFYHFILPVSIVKNYLLGTIDYLWKYWIPIIWAKWDPRSGLPLNLVPLQW